MIQEKNHAKTHLMAGKVVRNILKIESTANRPKVGMRETKEARMTKLLSLRTRQKVLSFIEMGKKQDNHLERKMGESRVPGCCREQVRSVKLQCPHALLSFDGG